MALRECCCTTGLSAPSEHSHFPHFHTLKTLTGDLEQAAAATVLSVTAIADSAAAAAVAAVDGAIANGAAAAGAGANGAGAKEVQVVA